MIVLPHREGHAVVTQAEHARMCGVLGRAWADPVSDEVILAAEQHELGMLAFDADPELDPDRGLPRTVNRMRLEAHLPLRLDGPRRLAEASPYAALLASLHHTSFYSKPPVYGLLRRPGRLIAAYLRESRAFQDELRARVDVPGQQVDRDWRLVRNWDGCAHRLMFGEDPDQDPWPFTPDRLALTLEARLLEGTFSDRGEMLRALASAPRIELSYELARPSTSRRSSESPSPPG